MDSIERIIMEFFPNKSIPSLLKKFIKWIVGEDKLASALESIADKRGIEWTEDVADQLGLRAETHFSDYDNIPAQGPTIVFSNHPTVLDGLMVINTVSQVRKDIKIVANHVLTLLFPQVKDIAIGIRNMQGKMSHKQLKEMNDHLAQNGVLIIFPAGKLAGLTLFGLREAPWQEGFLRLAVKYNAALVPVHIQGRNSFFYYLAAAIWRPLSNLMLCRECLKHKGKTRRIKISRQINISGMDKNTYRAVVDDCKKHLINVGPGKPGVLPQSPPIARPEERSLLHNALNKCEILRTNSDGKVLFLYHYRGEIYSPILNELGRLREICFRAIGAGTGKKRDNDIYDREYYHVILWDPYHLEIAGAYRLIPAGKQIDRRGVEGLYSHHLFHYNEMCLPQIRQSVEIGRGFIQRQYQRTNALDILWKGIFYFINTQTDCKHLLGVLTIPGNYPRKAQQLIVGFYQLYFSVDEDACCLTQPYLVSDITISDYFTGEDFEKDWKKLLSHLRELNCELPWPYKQAAKWYKPGGSKLFCFVEDKSFNSIAGLNCCEVEKLKNMYHMHYLSRPPTDVAK
ncbi:lysophospholipid acyltransferase family protein [Erwinia sp. 9145]|uniref:lysophospholipid acyltransferase family protein n=1 Tax=Erwinia sp. 9145 TaxID=1500895 RepID=UPI00054E833E|nr:lysophospholipid acyltransferase family protein [Erwinia sp. 9145]